MNKLPFQTHSWNGACLYEVEFSSVQSLSRVLLFATPWTTARQASLSITNSWSLPKFMSIESVIPSNHLIFCCPLLLLPSIFTSIGVFSSSQLFASGGRRIGASNSAAVLPMNIQGWFPLELTCLVSLHPRDSQESSPAPNFKNINPLMLSLFDGPTLTSVRDYW